ncbi:Sec-independent protein translocase subunit TatA/TatB [Tessaracoccus caeni]|uniref:Sec-independent protein translocase subunit TatA/TatB n=1 Tax=Tessaracoccus caeni TaxID=3031239 RepID=UPI0023DA1D62|nr:twin-arginine translocase TatA/TatE family subunit [Tessaracoccus caeni]MDF1488009.1 twin-arginine translocase TatA/TatE family subunit [Tessaracoccus caeni]
MPGGWELIIILVVALLLFGGSRLAGLGKGVGRSIREFKEEVKAVEPVADETNTPTAQTPPPPADGGYSAPSPTAPSDPTEQR